MVEVEVQGRSALLAHLAETTETGLQTTSQGPLPDPAIFPERNILTRTDILIMATQIPAS